MRNKTLFGVLFGLIILFFSVNSAQALFDEKPAPEEKFPGTVKDKKHEPAEYVPGEIIIKFKPELGKEAEDLFKSKRSFSYVTGTDTLDNLNYKHKVKKAEKIFKHKDDEPESDLGNIYKFELEDPAADILKVVEEYKRDASVVYAEPNFIVKTQMIPNDPYYTSRGSWGQTYDDLWGLKTSKINAETAWNIAQGAGVVVAVIDTGVDYTHEDIAANMWANTDEIAGNGIDDDHNGYIDDVKGWDFANNDNDPKDDHGHGTHCSGTIAAVGNNGKGIIGVAPQAKIMAVKGLSAGGSGSTDKLAQCVRYAADNGAKVLSNSWGGGGRSSLLIDAFNYAYSKGCVNIAAAGNSSSEVGCFSPANIAIVIAVAATASDDTTASFSNYGDKIAVAAPGVDVLSLRAAGTDMYGDGTHIVGEKYYRASGTSMACPHVAGLAALILSKHPEFNNEEVKQVMRVSAKDLGDAGFDIHYGFGRIDCYKAVLIPSVCTAKINLAQYAFLGKTVEIRGSASGSLFKKYTLSCKARTSGITTIIKESTCPVSNGVLATWDTTAFPDDLYTLQLTVLDSLNNVFTDIVSVYVDKKIAPGWPVDITSFFAATPVIADVDNDSKQEIVVKTLDEKILILRKDGSQLSSISCPGINAHDLFSRFYFPSIGTPSVLVDLDKDGDLEILYSANFNVISAVHHDGKPVLGWPVFLWLQPFFAEADSFVMGADDINGDSFPEIICMGKKNIHVLDHQGLQLFAIPNLGNTPDPLAMAIGDIAGDAKKEIIIGMENNIGAYNCDGSMVTGWPKTLPSYVSNIAIGDADKDGKYEIFATASWTNQVFGFKQDGTPLPNWPVSTPKDNLGALALGDVNNDGYLEIFAGCTPYAGIEGPKVLGWKYTGAILPGWPVNGTMGVRGISIADLDNNGTADVIVQPWTNKIFTYDANGALLPGLTFESADIPECGRINDYAEDSYYPAIGDIDNDGKSELIAGDRYGNRIYVWKMPAGHNPKKLEWPMFHHDPAHTSRRDINSDLIITGVSFSKNPVNPKDDIDVFVRYKYSGDSVYVPNFSVRILENGQVLRTAQYGLSLSEGCTGTIVFGQGASSATFNSDFFRLAKEGINEIKVTLDYTNVLREKNETNNEVSQNITVDRYPPTGTIQINLNAPYTNSVHVALTLAVSDATSGMGAGAQMSFSNDGTTWSTAEAYKATKAWTLTAGDGIKTVYAKFKDVAGNWSAVLSDTIVKNTPTAAPAAPTGLVTALSYYSYINLTWNDNSTNEDGFKIECSTNAGAFTQVATVPINTKTFQFPVVAGSVYSCRVRAYNPIGNSAYSNTTTITIPGLPTAASNLQATLASQIKVDLRWQDNSSNEVGFIVYRSVNKGAYSQLAVTGPNIITYSDTAGLVAGATYIYMVRAYNTTGLANCSNAVSIIIPLVPSAPSNLTATAVSSSQINLSWVDNSSNETGFYIERSVAGGAFTQIAKVGADVKTYSNTGLSSATTYSYRVRAFSSIPFALTSGYSNIATAKTL